MIIKTLTWKLLNTNGINCRCYLSVGNFATWVHFYEAPCYKYINVLLKKPLQMAFVEIERTGEENEEENFLLYDSTSGENYKYKLVFLTFPPFSENMTIHNDPPRSVEF